MTNDQIIAHLVLHGWRAWSVYPMRWTLYKVGRKCVGMERGAAAPIFAGIYISEDLARHYAEFECPLLAIPPDLLAGALRLIGGEV